MTSLRIGQLAGRAGVRVDTLRYYERRGLLLQPPRTGSGYRQYSAEAVHRVRFIKRAQGLGFTLEEIQALLALAVEPRPACAVVEEEARRVLARVDSRIGELQRLRENLLRLVAACGRDHPGDACPILLALEDQEKEV